ncbi:type IV pilin [Enterobacter mori]|uniref:type IV pilus major pilin n=1 Tax=Enterobacter mori TaxID=539813 RepID=UPI000B7EBED9|nr:type IV pilus major pilin [Enterobacter mori]OXL39176.1 type IV pilin [Enterobacter mori]
MDTMILDLKGNVARKVAQVKEMRKQRGVTLLEIIIVLGIIGVIAAGVVVLAQRAFTAQDLSDIQNNANSIRTSMSEAFKDEAEYPAPTATAINLTKSDVATATDLSPIVTLNKLGKISPNESFNGISGDVFQIGNAIVDASSTVSKGFVVLVNGLDQETCRNLISQMGNQWDYVGVINAPSGVDQSASLEDVALDSAVSATVLKSLATSADIPAATIVADTTCNNTGASNGIVFGSK